ncbi:MAG: dihydropteroate synthase [Phycisphaeraceae bacterium]|nr:dihydropteroate synthase [Phycisphaeraceae bacterium]
MTDSQTSPRLASSWRLSDGIVLTPDRPRIVAILNVTPDSFADGGANLDPDRAAETAARAVGEGADMIDIGGESTRPGAATVSTGEQIRRVVPVIERLRRRAGFKAPISVDTTDAEVARAAIDAGANAVNDVSGGEDPGMLPLVAHSGTGIVLMHRVHPPASDRYSDRYNTPPLSGDVCGTVSSSLREKMDAALRAGVAAERILLDPGLGFGKTVRQNLLLICQTHRLRELGRPLMSALSRKSFVGRVGLGRESDPSERLHATLALSVMHLREGAGFFRVHDVGPHRQALDAACALLGAEKDGGLPE